MKFSIPHPRRLTSASLLLVALAAYALLSPSCASWDGHFDVLGYSTRPNYDTRFRTIRIPICKNHTYWTVTPVPGMEMDLHRALVREIHQKTPYKVVQGEADTELVCTIVDFRKNLLNYTQFNTVREAETVMTIEMYWRDLRTGEILTRAARRPGEPLQTLEPRQAVLATPDSLFPQGSKPVVPPPATPTPAGPVPVPPGDSDDGVIDPVTRKPAVPVVIRSTAQFRPELGESITTAMQRNVERMAIQIVSTLEQGW